MWDRTSPPEKILFVNAIKGPQGTQLEVAVGVLLAGQSGPMERLANMKSRLESFSKLSSAEYEMMEGCCHCRKGLNQLGEKFAAISSPACSSERAGEDRTTRKVGVP
eukprot:scpid98577/ scgid27526/ 